MDLTSPKTIKELLSAYQAAPVKTLGQNFLVDRHQLEKIVAAAELTPDETVLEIGPGLGTLTQALAQKAKQVISIEKDHTMTAILEKTLEGFTNVEVVNADALSFKLQATSHKVVANIPYYITSPLIRKFLESPQPPSLIILMVQKEVAQRICAKAGDMNVLAASVQFYAKPEIVSYVSKRCFWPSPNVDSAILKITPDKSRSEGINPDTFFKVVKAGFLHPRKKLINNLAEGLIMEKEQVQSWLLNNTIDPSRRAETLALQEWRDLSRTYQELNRLA